MKNHVSLLILGNFFVSGVAFAGFHGEVSGVHNTPGYIESSPSKTFYQGASDRKDRDDGIERRSPSEMLLSYFTNDRLDQNKINALIAQMKAYDTNAYLLLCQSDSGKTDQAACDADNSVQKDWKSNSYHLGVQFAIKQLKSTLAHSPDLLASELNLPKNQAVLENFFSAFETWEAIKDEDDQRSRLSKEATGILDAQDLFGKNEISADRPEASNLLVPPGHPRFGKQVFLSEQDLDALKNQGEDLSMLDPPSTGMWRKPNQPIRSYDTTNNNQDGLVQLRKLYSEDDAKAILDPNVESVAVFKLKAPDGGNSPKMDVMIGKVKWKLKFLTNRLGYMGATNPAVELQKLAWGSEVNVEPVANNLAGAIGFSIDPTYFKKKVRVYFEDNIYADGKFDESLAQMKQLLTERFSRILNIDSAFSVVKTDDQGRKYIEIKSVTLEQKSNPATDVKLGFFDHVGLGKDLAREHRAFSLFLAFICDLDVKNQNDTVKLVPTAETYKVMDQNSDMGNGLALGYPNIYNFPLVRKVNRDQSGHALSFEMNYPRNYPLPMLKIVNLNDAKWFGRLLGQLTPVQIEAAFNNAGYVPLVSKYFALVVAKKRNELLNAVDLMGTSFKNYQGEIITLQALPEFTGSIPGFESYFKDGLLTDPNDSLYDSTLENWPRHWGISRRVFAEDDKTNEEIRMMIRNSAVEMSLKAGDDFLNRAVIHPHGNGIEFARIIDHRLGVNCGSDCFVQGLDYGLRNFIPMRYLVDSPMLTDDPTKPLWIVDVMRIGFYAGDRGEMLQGLLGFEVPTSLNARLGERAFRLYEIIKVTPISGMSEYFSNTQNFAELPRYALPHLRDQVVNSLAEGQTLLVSTYTGAEAEARVSLTATPFFSVRVGGNLTETARTTIYHPHGQYFVNWSAEKSSGEGLALNLFDRIIQVPLAKEAWRKAHHLESTFVFDDSGAEKELLLQNLVKPDASSLPDHFRWEKRDTDSRSRESSLSFLGLRTGKRLVNKLETHYENFQQEYNSHTKTVSIGTESTRLRDIVKAHWAKTAEVLVNTSGEVAVCMDFDLDYPSAEKEKLLPILNRYRSFFPDSLFLFNPEYVKHYMGNVTANAKTFYNQAMLEKLFADSWTKETMCNVYAPSCNTSFFNHFARVRKSFSTLKLNGAAARDRFYKRMARFFLDHAESTEFAKIVLGASALKQDAQINSELAAFPGDEASLASSPADAIPASTNPTLFSDKIEDSLKNVFFAPATQ